MSGRLEAERQKREKYLQRKVQETLCLPPPPQPANDKGCAHGMCSVSSEELKAQSRAYQEKLRLNRILQVRAQEMLFASKRNAEFRDRKTKDSKMLINHLKEVWSKDQRRRIASLEEEFANACQSIGLSHDAAVLVERNKAAKEELMARQAEESRYWDTLRFEDAMQKEREQRELRERGDSASTLRRKIVESVSSIERSFARRYNHGAKPKPQEKHAYGCSQTVNPPVTHDTTREKVYTKLAGFPIDFKDTYLHSRFDVLHDRTNRPSSAVVNCPEQEEVDAWQAADAQRESNRCERARQIELERLYNERKLERGSAAAAKLLNDQRIALLEQEVEEAFREEEREQERLHAVTGPGICKRATSAGQQRRPMYTKHKISNPLSCPGLPHTSLTCSRCRSYVELPPLPPKPVEKEPSPDSLIINCEPDGETGFNISVCPGKSDSVRPEDEKAPEDPPKTNRKPKSLQDNTEKQDPVKIDIQGKKIQLADLVSYQAQQKKEVELSGSTRKSADGRLMNSEGGAEGVILEPGVTKSLPHYPVQAKRKGISPVRASCVEGNVMKQPRVKSPNKCPMPKQNADGSDRTGKRLFPPADEGSGPARRWRSREKERDSDSWIKDLAEKSSPGKTRYHMELVREAAEVEKEVEEFYKGSKRRPVPQRSPSSRSVENGERSNGETQRSQRDVSRPPFISSGTIGYKKLLAAPLLPRTSRPASEGQAVEKARENLKPLIKGSDLENLDADEQPSPPRDRHRQSSGANNHGMETSRSWAHPVRPHSRPLNPPKGLKTINHQSDDQGHLNDSAPKRDPASPRNRNKEIRSAFETWNGSAGNCNGSELVFEIGKPREENAKKGNGQEKRIQEPKLRHKAVWKSYMDEKTQNSRKNLQTSPTAKSEPCSPPARMERATSSRGKRQADQQEVGFEQPLVTQNCHTPAASVKSLPISRPRNGRDKSVPRSWKYLQENSKGTEVEALENINTKIKSPSSRFHSPVTRVPRETSPLRKNRKVVTLHPSGNLAEKDASPSNVADTLLTAWKTGKFQDDYVRAMKRAKEITSGSSSSGISKIFSDRNYSKPWLSRSPFRRSVDREVNDVSLNQRSVSANPRTNHKSPMSCFRSKPWVANSSSRSSPERIVRDRGLNHRSGSTNPKSSNRSPMSRTHAAATMLSPKRTNWTSQSLLGPESCKSSPVKSRAGKRETTRDPWEGQSLDFVLGSLAEQVRELDERLRSATESSPALSSSSSLSREVYGNREKQIPDQPLPEKLNYGDRGSPSSTSATSSPESVCIQQLNPRGPPAARYISRGYRGGQKDSTYRGAKRPASTGTYMDELKMLLKEISSDNPSPRRRNHVRGYGRRVEVESKPHKVQDVVKKTELLHKNGITRPKVMKTEVEPDFTSCTSANTSRPCSVASQRDPRETRQGRSPVIRNGRESSKGRVMHDAFYGNGNSKLKGEIAFPPVYERRSVPQENGFREDNGMRRVMERRLVQSGWTQSQVAGNLSRGVEERLVQNQERFEKRTVEVRSCAPQHVLHNGHTVVREQLVKEVVENGLPSPETNGHDSPRRNSQREQKDANGKVTPVKQKRNDGAPQQILSNGKFESNGNVGRGPAQRRSPAAHPTSNGHKMTTNRRPTQQMQDQTRDYALSNGGEKLKSPQLESPLWGEGSPHCSGSWRKGAVNRDEIEDRMLLSGSVDFSPWNTEKILDIGTPQIARENRSTRGKPPSPIAEDAAGNGSLSPKIQRAKSPAKLNKPFGQRPVRKDAQPNGEAFFHPHPAPVRETMPKSQARPNLKKPKPVPRGIDALWSLNDQDTALKPSAAQNGVPPTLRKSSPAEKVSPVRTKRRTASVPKARMMKEQTSSPEEVPNSTSKSSHDDNYLPVIMAKDPESRQRVIDRRKKALQLDMEHRQRLARNSRPASARSSL